MQKLGLKNLFIINHIDHDPSNNHVDNLEYVTPRENSLAALKHYGGLMANKSKQNDDCIKFIEPVFNPLLNRSMRTEKFNLLDKRVKSIIICWKRLQKNVVNL